MRTNWPKDLILGQVARWGTHYNGPRQTVYGSLADIWPNSPIS